MRLGNYNDAEEVLEHNFFKDLSNLAPMEPEEIEGIEEYEELKTLDLDKELRARHSLNKAEI